ncbi:hypothetical protein CN319_17625, partial [Bacillus cereus]
MEYERSFVVWKEWISKKNYTNDFAGEGKIYVVNHMKLRDYQVSVLMIFFDEYLNLLDHGEEQASLWFY